MFNGYGRSWSEPLAKGRWNRFKQRMREPATTTENAVAWVVIFLATSWGLLISVLLFS